MKMNNKIPRAPKRKIGKEGEGEEERRGGRNEDLRKLRQLLLIKKRESNCKK